MFQTKEQDKIPEEELNEVDTGNLPNKESKVMNCKDVIYIYIFYLIIYI